MPSRQFTPLNSKLSLVFVIASLMLIFVSYSPSQLEQPQPAPVDRWSVGYWSPGGNIPLPISEIDFEALTHVIDFAAYVSADGTLDLATAEVPRNGPPL